MPVDDFSSAFSTPSEDKLGMFIMLFREFDFIFVIILLVLSKICHD